jgi:hypothetical protein
MSSKRVLDLERAKEKVKRLTARIKEEEERFAVYLREELGFYLRHQFDSVARVSQDGINRDYTTVVFKENDCRLRIYPDHCGSPQLVLDGSYCMALYPDKDGVGCYLESTTRSDADMLRRLTTLVAVFPDARRIVSDILPAWHKNPPNAESLMTTRVLHWIAKEYKGHHQLADVITGTLIKVIH